MAITRSALGQVVEAVLETGAYKATKFLGPKETVKATRRRYKRRGRHSITQVLVTVGRPNYAERAFIKKAQAAGEPFPIKKVLLKF